MLEALEVVGDIPQQLILLADGAVLAESGHDAYTGLHMVSMHDFIPA